MEFPVAGKNRTSEGEMPEEELERRLRALDDRLDRNREARVRESGSRPDNSGFGNALRLSTEFVSAVLVGAAIGWGVDKVTGYPPWGMIFFLILGFVAGVLNVMRAAGSISDPHRKGFDPSAAPAKAAPVDDEDEDE
ncbi:MAG: AtpZ/AtpI family protein [Nitratireductor sp.]|nr:AtpZ/AtpI family protein [Nitratireductor sp.]